MRGHSIIRLGVSFRGRRRERERERERERRVFERVWSTMGDGGGQLL